MDVDRQLLAACSHILQMLASALLCRQPESQSAAFLEGWKDTRIPSAGFHLRRGTSLA
jgi:hypothetical protein